MRGLTGRFGIEPLLVALYHAACKIRRLRNKPGEVTGGGLEFFLEHVDGETHAHDSLSNRCA